MAEVKITRSEITRPDPRIEKADVAIVREVVVRSIRCDRMDASVLRDLVRALDFHGVSDRAKVTGSNGATGHLVQIVVEQVEHTTPDDGEGGDDAAHD